jgi:hypothetical protein
VWSRTLKSGAFHAHCFANYRCETLPHMWSRLVLAVVMTGISAQRRTFRNGRAAEELLSSGCRKVRTASDVRAPKRDRFRSVGSQD